jgi:hypothetical protein
MILVDFVVDGKSIFLVLVTLYCQGFGKNVGRSVRLVDIVFYATSFFDPHQVFTNFGLFSLFLKKNYSKAVKSHTAECKSCLG